MSSSQSAEESLRAEVEALKLKLAESEETLRAIRAGEVDALIVEGNEGPRLFVLQDVDIAATRFRSDILAKVSEAIVAVDETRRVIYLNAAAEAQYGVVAEVVLGQPLESVYRNRWLSAEDEEKAWQELSTHDHWRGRTIHVKGNGEEVHVETSVSRLRSKDGEPSGMLGVIRDISLQIRAEESLRAAKESAEAANQSKDRFLAVLSHELRTPLTPVLMTVDALSADPSLSPALRGELAMIKRNIELETTLIDDLLDVNRITTGKIVLKNEYVELNQAVQQAIAVCQQQLNDQAVRFEVVLADHPLPINADPARLQQVLWNVLKNAIKFSSDSGTVRVLTSENAGQAQVIIQDDGIGIAPELLTRIFDAFEQGDKGVTRQFGGLGLGLAISKALLELHGGSIRADSPGRGQGSTFTIELPLDPRAVPTAPVAAAATRSSDVKPEKPLHLLVVEDHSSSGRTLKRLLESQGYAVTLAVDLQSAVECARQASFDLLLTDLGLPDGSGYDVMSQVQKIQKMPAIVMSGFGMDQDLRQSTAAGFATHIVKPFRLPDLMEAIRRATST